MHRKERIKRVPAKPWAFKIANTLKRLLDVKKVVLQYGKQKFFVVWGLHYPVLLGRVE